MTTNNKKETHDWHKEFDEDFPWAVFCWNGDNHIGEKSAKEKRAKLKRFISKLEKDTRERTVREIREIAKCEKYLLKKEDWGDGIITDENAEDNTMSLAETLGWNNALDYLSSLLPDQPNKTN